MPELDRFTPMDLTLSFEDRLPRELLAKYEFSEVRNAAAVIASTNPELWGEIQDILRSFSLRESDLVDAGGNKSGLAARLDESFRERGWRESRVDTLIELALKVMPYRKAGETKPTEVKSLVENKGYKVDNFKGRIALDVEWNAKDGNLDRDLAAYRALYDFALIDAAVLVTRTQDDLRQLALSLSPDSSKFATTTTTNLSKLVPRLKRGDAGGCPVLAVAICSRTYPGIPPFLP